MQQWRWCWHVPTLVSGAHARMRMHAPCSCGALCCAALCCVWVWVWVRGRACESRMYDGISDRKRSCPAVSHLVGVEFEPMSCWRLRGGQCACWRRCGGCGAVTRRSAAGIEPGGLPRACGPARGGWGGDG
eukprot:scaffold122712_cov66-Phaeocystis_antarctica.AAC.3